jgi:hypothetical protein
MQVQSVRVRLTQAALDLMAANAIALAPAAGALHGAEMGLLAANAPFSLTMTEADIQEPTFAGYARMPVVWGTVGHDAGGRSTVHSGSVEFSPTDDVVPTTIFGVALFSAVTAGVLLGVGNIGSPVELNGPVDDLTVALAISYPGTEAPDWGTAAVLH